MSSIMNLLRPAYCRMWQRPLLAMLLGLSAASMPIALLANCNGGTWGSICVGQENNCMDCEHCVTVNCSNDCMFGYSETSCEAAGDQTCATHFKTGC